MTVPSLTIFTPTYNRAATLPRLYASLADQTSRDFKWLIVDDGSTDGTRDLIDGWKASAAFSIEYKYQENHGKHGAINTAIALVDTELVLVLDSDDELLPAAVETILRAYNTASPEERARLAGVWTVCIDSDGKRVSDALPEESIDTSIQELRYRYSVARDMLRCFVTSVWRRYPFPQTPPGICPYIPEGYVWSHMTREYSIRFLNVPCSRVHYQPTGLSAIARHQYRFSRSALYAYLQPLDSDLEWFWYEPVFFVMSAVQAVRYGLFSRELWRLSRSLDWKAKALMLAVAPTAIVLLARDWLSGRIAREMSLA